MSTNAPGAAAAAAEMNALAAELADAMAPDQVKRSYQWTVVHAIAGCGTHRPSACTCTTKEVQQEYLRLITDRPGSDWDAHHKGWENTRTDPT